MRGKRWAALTVGILWLWGLCAAGAAQAQETVYLRVIGRDDTERGQAEKRRVRDAVLSVCPADWTDPEALLQAADRAANAIADCETQVRIWQPEGGVPARTLFITIGAGRGHNWWGILYGDAAKIISEETDGEEITVVWPLWDWLRRLLGI